MKSLPAFFLACLCLNFAYAQTVVSGKVTEEGTDIGLPGVTVTAKVSNTSTLTDVSGDFQLEVPSYAKVLTFSAPGYKTINVNLGSSTVVNVSLPAIEQGEISLGIGSQPASELTSSVAQIQAADISATPVVDLEQANQGRASGIFIQNNSGKLGEGTTIRIRGGSSLSGTNQPLYVVDGVPLVSASQNAINPNNIASMEILKDASAAALYGSRAANGVIIITTKSGRSSKPQFDIDYQFGISQTPEELDLYSAAQYNAQFLEFGLRDVIPQLELLSIFDDDAFQQLLQVESILAEGSAENYQRWAEEGRVTLANGTVIPIETVIPPVTVFDLIGNTLDSLIYNTDWQDQIFRNGISHRANVNVSGGTDKLNYFGGLSFIDQEGILIGNQFQRFNGRLNLGSQLSEKISLDYSLNYAYTNDDRLNEDQDLGSPMQALALPSSDGFDPSDNYNIIVQRLLYNPLTEVNFADNVAKSNSVISNLNLTFQLNDELSLKVEGGVEIFDQDEERRQGPETQDGGLTGLSRFTNTKLHNYIGNGYLQYSKPIDESQKLDIILGSSYQISTIESSFRSADVNSIDVLNALNPGEQGLVEPLIADSKSAFLSFYTRANYSLNNKYLFQLSVRADGSSRFSEDNRIGVFPALSAGWNLANESFLEGNAVIDALKLKASYGIVGNTPDADFLYRTNYFQAFYGNQESAIVLNNLANADLKWESTAQTDIGVEISILENRISATIDYYRKETEDLLFPVPVSPTSGFTNVLKNTGKLTNSGFEFSMATVNVQTEDFQWTTSFNITTNNNEITDIPNQLVVGVSAFIEGESSGVFYTRRYVGVDPGTGDALYDNGSGGTTTDYENAPRMVVGDPNPDFFGGLSNRLQYQNFSLDFQFQFVQGVDIYNATDEFLANSGAGSFNLNQKSSQVNRWYKPGDDALYPRLDPFLDNTNPSSRFVEDGSYIRLKTLMLSYQLPESAVSGLNLSSVEFYVGGQNLLTFTDYSGFDPDVNYVDPNFGTLERNISRGIDNFTAPQARTIFTGFKISF